MGLMKKKVNNDLIVSLCNYEEADYEKASPELKKLHERIVNAHENVEDIFLYKKVYIWYNYNIKWFIVFNFYKGVELNGRFNYRWLF